MQLLVLPEQPQAPLGPPMLLSMQMRTRGQCILQGIRIMRGQGDCLYRALVYGILEQIILSTTAVSRMAEFRKDLSGGIEHMPQSDRKDRLKSAIALLTTGPGEMCVDIHSLTVQVALESNGVDKALIEISREIVHRYVSENRHGQYGDGEFTVQQQMELADERKRTFEQQLQDILTMGEEASDQLVNMGLAFQALKVQCDVLTPTPTGRYQLERLNESQRYPTATIAIECKGAHYDIAYIRRMTEMEKFQDKNAEKEDAAAIARKRKEDQEKRRQQATQDGPDKEHAANRNNNNRNTADQDQGKGGTLKNRVFPVP